MSNNHSFQGRTKKLSGWVKRIIQPTKDQNSDGGAPRQDNEINKHSEEIIKTTSRDSHIGVKELEDDTNKSKILWDEIPKKVKVRDSDHEREEIETVDNVSITPLFSMCSSSVKSSTFSDSHSLQSTRATVVSGRTLDTNSSTVAIPPASILDRARISSSATSAATVSSSVPNQVHLPSNAHQSRPSSLRLAHLQREDGSSTTIDSISTIK